jgi:hypothetical protein
VKEQLMREARRWTPRRLQLPGAVALLFVLEAALVVGCSSAKPESSAPPPQVQEDTISWFFTATVAQSNDAGAFLSALHSLAVQAGNVCMEKYGFGPQATEYLDSYEDYLIQTSRVEPGYIQVWNSNLVDVQAVAATGMLAEVVTGTKSPPTVAGVSSSEEQAVKADLTRCLSRVRGPSFSFQQAGRALERLWRIDTAKADQAASVQAARRRFGVCVTRQGAPSVAATPAQFQNWLADLVDPAASYDGTMSAGPRLALDARWTAVWANCAGLVVSAFQAQLVPVQKSFLQKHFQEVEVLERQVAKSEASLQRMGTTQN